MKITEAERHVLQVLWENGSTSAKDISVLLNERLGWKKTTTYTMITRCLSKGYLKRDDPGFLCTALVSKQLASEWATDELISSSFSGSADLLVASLIGRKKLSVSQMETLYKMLQEMEQQN